MASDNKDMMAKHASWSEGILGDKAAPSAVAYSWIDRNVPVSGRTHMLLADLTASVHARSPGLSVQQAVLAAAKDMVQKGVATGDLRTFVEQGGRFSRPGAKDMMATRNPKAREKWETVFYEYFDGVPVSIMDSAKIKNDISAILASGADLKVEMPKLVKKYGRFSRPGAKAKFKVEDRFYFGKGRKERFAEPREIEAKIRAWIDSRGLPIGLQETNALSYIAAQNMLRGGVSIQQAVKSAARRHAQIGLASAGLRTWLEENS